MIKALYQGSRRRTHWLFEMRFYIKTLKSKITYRKLKVLQDYSLLKSLLTYRRDIFYQHLYFLIASALCHSFFTYGSFAGFIKAKNVGHKRQNLNIGEKKQRVFRNSSLQNSSTTYTSKKTKNNYA